MALTLSSLINAEIMIYVVHDVLPFEIFTIGLHLSCDHDLVLQTNHFHFDTHLKISKDVRPLFHYASPSSHIVGLTVELFYKKWLLISCAHLRFIGSLHSHKIPQTDLSSKTDYPNAPYICYFGGTPKKGVLHVFKTSSTHREKEMIAHYSE
eukprot:scaffold10544_cov269-Chaetoceros_neogracile.AAC.3